MNSFLKETKYCDFNNPVVQEIVKKYKGDYANQRDLAVALFYYVRDNILYRVGHWNRKASETILEKKGVCTSKANLLVALLRASGIPAGYGVMRVKGQEYFGPIVPSFLRGKISKESVHIYTYAYLNGSWLKCDASDDEGFSKNTSCFNPQSKLTDWDGKCDASLNLDASHILKDDGPLAGIDDLIEKKPSKGKSLAVKAGNLYINFLRETEGIRDAKQAEELFLSWLKKKYLLFYIVLSISLFWFSLKKKI